MFLSQAISVLIYMRKKEGWALDCGNQLIKNIILYKIN